MIIYLDTELSTLLCGVKFRAYPTSSQAQKLAQWMGCARVIYNAKVEEERYYSAYARKYLPVGTYAPFDQKYAQFKDPELTPWLDETPSPILRNACTNWYEAYQRFLKGLARKPKLKKKSQGGSIYLTSELFQLEKLDDGSIRLFIGQKKNNIGYLEFEAHRSFEAPKSIRIRQKAGKFWVSFCYEDGQETALVSQKEHLEHLRGADQTELEKTVIGIDRGVVIPVQAGAQSFDLSPEEKKSKRKQERHMRVYQKRLARQTKGSGRREKTKRKLSRAHEKKHNIQIDFCHKTTRTLVTQTEAKVFVLEDLKIKQMTAAPKPKKDEQGRYVRNGARAKAGLNKAILNVSWYRFESFLKYKAEKAGKAWFKVSAQYTSQECACCGHTHPDQRKSQALFECLICGHKANADYNAAEVIKKRAVQLILHPGTGLSARGVLSADIGRGVSNKSSKAKAKDARDGKAKVSYPRKSEKKSVKSLPVAASAGN